MKTYLIYATTNEKWELCETSLLVKASNESKARKKAEDWLKARREETIMSVELVTFSKEDIIVVQESFVE